MALKIKIIRLITGEEILAEEILDTDQTITFKNPLRVLVMPSKNDPNNPAVGFVPWCEFAENKQFTINKSHVLTTFQPIQEFLNQYNKVFGGIIAPSSKLILPT